MAFKKYHLRVACSSAATGSGATMTALARVKSLEFQLLRRPVVDRSDHSYVPTVLDVVHEGWRWRVVCRDGENAQAWLRQQYIGASTFYVYSATSASTYDTICLKAMAVDEFTYNGAWNELGAWTLGGWCALIDANGTSLENMSNRTGLVADNLDFDGDTVNQWDSSGT